MKRLLCCLTAIVSTASAQMIPTINLYTTYTDNLFLNYNQRSDLINATYIDLDYFVNEDLSFYYAGSTSVFTKNADLFAHLHTFGSSYTRSFGIDNLIYAGTEIGLRLDRPLYAYRDFAEGHAFATVKFYLRPDVLGRLGYSLHYRNFLNADEYTYADQRLKGRLIHTLPSHTTLLFGAELGVKSYLNAAVSAPALFASPERSRHLLRWVARLKAAQSLGSNAGLQIEWLHRQQPYGQSQYDNFYLYDPDADLFDDSYSYGGNKISTTLKYLAPWQSELQTSIRRENRHYTNRPAYDLNGKPIAAAATEQHQTLSLSLGRTFYTQDFWFQHADVELEWLYRNIDSNDPFYETSAHSTSLGLQLGF